MRGSSLLKSPAAPASPWDRTDAWVLQGGGKPLVLLQAADGTEFSFQEDIVGDPLAQTQVESDRVVVWLDGERHVFDRVSSASAVAAGAVHGMVRAPMPGLILAVHVKQGEKVARGQALLVMEAMKMEHTLVAGGAGTVAELKIEKGARVRDGDLLLRVEE